jgi:signal transduction histidine kinase
VLSVTTLEHHRSLTGLALRPILILEEDRPVSSIPMNIRIQKEMGPVSRDGRFEVAARPHDLQAESVAALEKGIRSRDEVLAIVAHDLRNPLTIIKSSATLLQRTTDEDQKKELLDMIANSCVRMQSLVGDLLDVARIESGGFTVDPTDVDAAGVLEEMQRMFESAAAEKGIRFEADASGYLPPLYADRSRLIQILANLVSNALRATESGSVRLTLEGDRDKARFSVADSGPGIPAADLPHLFDRFWQVRASRRGGAGLGLAIVKGFVEAHQGTVEVTSEVGTGSLFTFVLPGSKDNPVVHAAAAVA